MEMEKQMFAGPGRDNGTQSGLGLFITKLAVWGDGGLGIPQKPSLKILLSLESF